MPLLWLTQSVNGASAEGLQSLQVVFTSVVLGVSYDFSIPLDGPSTLYCEFCSPYRLISIPSHASVSESNTWTFSGEQVTLVKLKPNARCGVRRTSPNFNSAPICVPVVIGDSVVI